MKILFMASGNVRSNFTYRVMALGRGLRARGHDVAIIAPKADKYNDFVPETITEFDGIRVLQPFQFATKRLEINLLPYMFDAARLVLAEKPDLVYIYKPTPISIVGLLAKVLRRTPVVLDMDDLGSEVMKIEGHPPYQCKLVEWCERLAAHVANRIVVASTYLRDMYTALYPTKPILWLPNGVEADWFKPATRQEGGPRIVFMGSINRKNILEPLLDSLPAVVKAYPKAHAVIIGDGQFLSYFMSKSKNLGLSAHVDFTGWLKLDDARRQLHAGDIGYNYMPNELTVRAASNMKIPQYMARGVVPLVSEMGDLPFAIDFGRAGYSAAPDSPQALTAALIQALGDPNRNQKAKNARQYAKRTFSWDKQAELFDNWLHRQLEPRSKKRIFVVASDVPGDTGGAPIRNFQLAKQLAQRPDTRVELFCLSKGDVQADKRQLEAALRLRAYVLPRRAPTVLLTLRALLVDRMQPFMTEFRASGLGDAVRAAAEENLPDVVHIEQTDAYFALRPHLDWLKRHGVKIVLDAHNVEAQAFAGAIRTFALPKRLIGLYLLPAFRRLEAEAALRADVVFTCSESDAAHFRRLRGSDQVLIVPNGVDCSHFTPAKKTGQPTMLFIGGVSYPANGDALAWYLREVHQLVRAAMPKARVLAIGADYDWLNEQGLAGDNSVQPLGFVPDIKPYLDKAMVGICPIREGSGTRLKVLTYMSAALPVVSTAKGAEGIAYTANADIVIADTPQGFADELIRLLRDPVAREHMGHAAHTLATTVYDWPIIGNQLGRLYERNVL